jgi:hypothetical protein
MIKNYPKIKFGINKDLEKEIFLMFLSSDSVVYPGFEFLLKNKYKKNKKEIISNFVDDYYSIKTKYIKKT